MLKALAVATLYVLCVSMPAMTAEPLMRLYFAIPFNIETYVPITEDDIEDQGYAVWFMFEQPFIRELRQLLEAHPATITPGYLRLKAYLPNGDVYLVDREGGVRKKNTGTTFQLTPDEIKLLETRLSGFRGVVDRNAMKTLLPK